MHPNENRRKIIGMTQEEAEKLLKAANTTYRIEKPGFAYTAEFRANRIRVHLDKNGIVVSTLMG